MTIRKTSAPGVLVSVLCFGVVGVGTWSSATPAAVAKKVAASGESCIDCHRQPGLLVTNKKLYDYYQNFLLSSHADQGVTCSDCHGGNPRARSKDAAHRFRAGEAKSRTSAINFRNVPTTCAECHESIMAGYKKSEHYAHLISKKQEARGPNCVTCHGSVNAEVLGAANVRTVCAKCHNGETKNHAEVPDEAARLLSRVLAADRYYRYVTKRGDAADLKRLGEEVVDQRAKLAETWHTFDLKAVDVKAAKLIDTMHELRDGILARRKAKP